MRKNDIENSAGSNEPVNDTVIYRTSDIISSLEFQDLQFEDDRSEFKKLFFQFLKERDLDKIGFLLRSIYHVNELILDQLSENDLEINTSQTIFRSRLIDVLEFRDNDGNSGLHYIASFWSNNEDYSVKYHQHGMDYKKIIDMFKDNLETENNEGYTPLNIAFKKSNKYFVSLILLEKDNILKNYKSDDDKKEIVDNMTSFLLKENLFNHSGSICDKAPNLAHNDLGTAPRGIDLKKTYQRSTCIVSKLKCRQLTPIQEEIRVSMKGSEFRELEILI